MAVVCPSKIQIEHWAKEHNVSGDFETICQNQKTKEFILGEFNRVAKDKKVCNLFMSLLNFCLFSYNNLLTMNVGFF